MAAEVEVVVSIAGEDVLAGRLWAHRTRGRESATFRYAESYLALDRAYELDPRLPLLGGPQHTAEGQSIFAAFSDCAPDRWGRRLIQRGERRRAEAESRTERSIGEIDYLLGVRDDLRQGALRFRDPDDGGYLAPEPEGVPDLVDLPRLLNAAERLERDEVDEPELQALLHGGSSLGGARPKAHVRDADGRVAIAKFPSPSKDEWDVMAWESVALKLAAEAGIEVPDSSLHRIDGRSVLIVDRFDRAGDLRIGYVSAMTMLEAGDGDQGSYLEIADVIERQSPDAAADLAELWRRIAFTILIGNTDDHLRNHGFLRESSAGWSLSPAFDINPDPVTGPRYLATAIDFDDPRASIENLMGVAPGFRLGEPAALAILAAVETARAGWRRAAAAAGIASGEIARMSPAFEHEQAEVARRLIAAGPDAR
ncbi:MAG TPA: HipA domain-containing protein [Solirubrobacterales bacterium]|jgi:serine/threonine-protein kinase HipA